ncbi:MAG: gamma-glutamyl-gamma-aminobutyrate hydrolase family protein, partial [Planctomycetaceae bacterium]
MPGKPVIGISGDYRAERKDAVALSWFNSGCYDSVTAAGGLPALIPPLSDDDDLSQSLDLLDG